MLCSKTAKQESRTGQASCGSSPAPGPSQAASPQVPCPPGSLFLQPPRSCDLG